MSVSDARGRGAACETPARSALTPQQRAFRRVLLASEPGDVMTYGEIAEEAGYPGRSRAVGRYLRDHDGVPWWRVVNSVGRLVPHNSSVQARLLRAEGVEVAEGRVVGMRRR